MLGIILAIPTWLIYLGVGIICFVIGALCMWLIPFMGYKNAKSKIDLSLKDAEIKANQMIKTAQLEGRAAALELKTIADKEIKEKKDQITELEKAVFQHEQSLDVRESVIKEKEKKVEEANQHLDKKAQELAKQKEDLDEKINSIIAELEKVAGMTSSQAKNELLERVKEKSQREIAAYLKEQEEIAKEKADDTARDILALSIERFSQEVASERTISVVSLPSDEMKGRIIGREGRNIKTIEQLTGVDLIIDDTPEVITVSCFNPIRREIAKRSLEALIKDGRIQPGRIEELVNKATQEVKEITKKAGEDALFQLNLPRMNKDLVEMIGRLKFRTSYGQNGLAHSIEVAHLAGIMAAELGVDQQLAKRAGLLHALGKAIDVEVEGSHVELGARYAKKYGENEVVINAIEAHHGEKPATHIISNLVIAADTLSAARPGARSETLDTYVKRIEKLEAISKEFDGVSQAYAIQAGREIRVMVVPEKVDDVQAYHIARQIKEKIENELVYPGQIKVTVVRETRVSEIAK